MKRIGIIAGLGPESTTDYYQRIIKAFPSGRPDSENPEIIIYSANLYELIRLMTAKDWPTLIDGLVSKVEALHRAGADFAAIASNTPHLVFDAVRARSPIPLLSIVEEACRKAQSLGLKKPGLLGTLFTMQSDFYRKVFEKHGITLVVPTESEKQLIHQRLFSEIELGIFKDSTRQELLAVVQRMITSDGIDSVILGCTELPLILTQDEFGIPFLNTAAIHVDRIVRYCLDKDA
ncbi:MAG TPA: aspartate racemase [Verrucomicrobia bacterium]|nr:MAG: aspartate racemase [Lentisphaerae bacterium GWF2_57_35]HBA82467.1 aspartate racemase [Verrucomicrobiota bacterium]